jgi:multisubunit Na+/H+ antiporter MnhB subunit
VIIGILIALALVLAMIVASKKPRQWSREEAPRAPEDWRLSLQAEREKTVRKLVLLSLVVVWLASVLALAVYWRVLPWFVSWTLCFVATALAPNLGSATWAWMKGRDGWAEL